MKAIRSLVLTRFRPHLPTSGAALRNWQNINALMSLGSVDVISLGSDARESSDSQDNGGVNRWIDFDNASLRDSRGFSERVVAATWRLRPDGHPLGRQYLHESFQNWLREHVAAVPYDIVVIEELPLAVYIPAVRHGNCKVIFDAHNVEGVLRQTIGRSKSASPDNGRSSSLRSFWRKLLARKLIREERQAVESADAVWVCSEDDAGLLKATYGRAAGVTVVPNTVDVQTYRRSSAADATAQWGDLPLTLIFPGTFAYYPNEDAALRLICDVLPILKAQRLDTRLVLLGKGPTEAMYLAAAGTSGITITGAVVDIRPFFDNPCVVALPIILGGGTRLKILEAFAASRPVVSTRKGAEGIEAQDGYHLFLRETPEEMAKAIIELWVSTAVRSAMVASAFELVQQKYSYRVARERVLQSLSQLGTAESNKSAVPEVA